MRTPVSVTGQHETETVQREEIAKNVICPKMHLFLIYVCQNCVFLIYVTLNRLKIREEHFKVMSSCKHSAIGIDVQGKIREDLTKNKCRYRCLLFTRSQPNHFVVSNVVVIHFDHFFLFLILRCLASIRTWEFRCHSGCLFTT